MIRGILKKITVCAAILIITLSVLLNLTYFILNTLPNNNRFFSALASRVLQEPVVIKKAKIEGFSIFPVIKLYGIAFGKKIPDASRIHLSELQVTLNLWHSFWQKQWITEKISIDHLKLRVDQDAKNNFHISGLSIQAISIEQDSALWSAITQWISAQPT
ncbi:MAG: hypothetical protein NTU49_04635, partial [Gammaproteobacteria bacterium]|nr:hypothetical protein [Gammaproteobacteria bacterium]